MSEIFTQAFARAGLIGNPSDGYYGKTIAFSVKNFAASVWLVESPQLEILPQASDMSIYASINELHSSVGRHGYYGGVRLIKATIKRFFDYCDATAQPLHERNFTIRYDSTIPQQVGLAGSSAIIVATLRALMQFYTVSIDKVVQPSLVLSVERDELGIAGGLQDRVIQIYEGLVQMDFSKQAMEQIAGYECGRYTSLEVSALPPLYLAYRPDTSEPTEVFHNDLRTRYEKGDRVVHETMVRFAALTDQAAVALDQRDDAALFNAINHNFDLRDAMCVLNPRHTEMISVARSVGASAKYAGSGGAIVGSYRDQRQFDDLRRAMDTIGCVLLKPQY